ncbi:MAG: helix-turn-helix transcriptional regulator [Clostridia bacterium]|nr:helix-turn-helix transcriptional regulator [Clostridia bacterium]
MEYDARITGRIIGRLRTERGMTQEVLSGLAGVARSHLTMIENGSKNANTDTLWRIAGALGLRLSQLMRMVEDEIGEKLRQTDA